MSLSLLELLQLLIGVWLVAVALKLARFGWRTVSVELPLAAAAFVLTVLAGRFG